MLWLGEARTSRNGPPGPLRGDRLRPGLHVVSKAIKRLGVQDMGRAGKWNSLGPPGRRCLDRVRSTGDGWHGGSSDGNKTKRWWRDQLRSHRHGPSNPALRAQGPLEEPGLGQSGQACPGPVELARLPSGRGISNVCPWAPEDRRVAGKDLSPVAPAKRCLPPWPSPGL